MQTSLFSFTVALADAARIFTLPQVARHPDVSGRTQPVKRASAMLREHAAAFEKMPGPWNQPFRWRLSRSYRRQHGIRTPVVHPMSQNTEHWLGLGDIWCELTFHGGRPTEWRCDAGHQFDVLCRWCGRLLLIEYQRTPLTSRRWADKWKRRKEWYRAQNWVEHPTIVLVNTTGQPDETVQAPRGTVHVRAIHMMCHAIMFDSANR